MTDDGAKRFVAQWMNRVEVPPGEEVQTLMQLMSEWLEAVVVDPGSPIDTGGGAGRCDLALYMGGRRLLVTIEESPFQVAWNETEED